MNLFSDYNAFFFFFTLKTPCMQNKRHLIDTTHLFVQSLCFYTTPCVSYFQTNKQPVSFIPLHEILTLPRSRMKQSPLLKLSQLTGTSVALTTRRPLTWSTRCTTTSLVTTCLKPDATPPFWDKQKRSKNQSQDVNSSDIAPTSSVCTLETDVQKPRWG